METSIARTKTQLNTADTVGHKATLACLLEVGAEKPGNVTPTRAFHDTSYEDFVRSAAAIGPELARACERGVGATILACVLATRRQTNANTNLGIVLLFAPLARAALLARDEPLREALGAVLATLTLEDARDAYAAIRYATPGGLDTVEAHDVRDLPQVTLLDAMASAATRDRIASEYTTGYAVTFERALPVLRAALAQGATPHQATVQTYLELLAVLPDTLIARKLGLAAAGAISADAAQVLAAGGIWTPAGRAAIDAFDGSLRDARNQRNPGTTADLVAAALFVALLEGVL
jgi:triphosphoribosyl-dephospho-CoA synthase